MRFLVYFVHRHNDFRCVARALSRVSSSSALFVPSVAAEVPNVSRVAQGVHRDRATAND
jgi:Na+/serine symporter